MSDTSPHHNVSAVDTESTRRRSAASTRRSDLTRSLFEDLSTETSSSRRHDIANQIIGINMCISTSIARRYRDRGESLEDLEQVAHLGLIKAVAGFDASRERDFLAYAVPTIAGEVKRHFRDQCWVVKPPRRIQELKSQIAGCTEMLRQTLGHIPRPDEIAGYLGAGLPEVKEALCAGTCFAPASLDVKVGDSESSSTGDLIGVEDSAFDGVELRSLLRPLLARLGSEDQVIVARRFIDQWTQEQIAQNLGISQMQISRRLGRIMQTLRQALGEAQESA